MNLCATGYKLNLKTKRFIDHCRPPCFTAFPTRPGREKFTESALRSAKVAQNCGFHFSSLGPAMNPLSALVRLFANNKYDRARWPLGQPPTTPPPCGWCSRFATPKIGLHFDGGIGSSGEMRDDPLGKVGEAKNNGVGGSGLSDFLTTFAFFHFLDGISTPECLSRPRRT
jgi:hypothetical protein